MALTLKAGSTYSYKGINIPSPYLCIDDNNGNKRDKRQHLVVEIYPSAEDRLDKTRVIGGDSYSITGDDFDTYFSPAAVSAGGDHYERAYAYILTIEENTGTEESPVMEKVWRDWESDE